MNQMNQMINGKREGYWEDNINIFTIKAFYKKGEYHGLVLVYSKDGVLLRETNFNEGAKHGLENLYAINGRLIRERYYENNKRVIDIYFYENGNIKDEFIHGRKAAYSNTGILNRNK